MRVLHGILESVGLRQPSTEDFIKRVIGLPGETVEGKNGKVYIDGRELVEPYLNEETIPGFEPKKVPEGKLWVMGDNRNQSQDARVFGPIDKDKSIGRAILRIWPIPRIGFLLRLTQPFFYTGPDRRTSVSAEDLERYETEIELQLYKEYRDVLPMFSYVVETERRFYLANDVKMEVKNEAGRVYFDVHLHDAWVWDMYRPARFVSDVHVVTFKDVNVEELAGKEI